MEYGSSCHVVFFLCLRLRFCRWSCWSCWGAPLLSGYSWGEAPFSRDSREEVCSPGFFFGWSTFGHAASWSAWCFSRSSAVGLSPVSSSRGASVSHGHWRARRAAGLPNSAASPTVPAAPLFAGALVAVLDISSLGSSSLVDIHMYGDAGCPSILQRTISSSSNVRTRGGRQGSLSASCLNLRASDWSHDLLHVRQVCILLTCMSPLLIIWCWILLLLVSNFPWLRRSRKPFLIIVSSLE